MKIRINKIRLFFGMLLIPYLEPLLFKEYKHIDVYFTLAKIITFLFCVVLLVVKRHITIYTILVVVFQGLLLISTVMNSGSVLRFLGPMVSIVGICMIAELYVIYDKMIHFYKSVINIYSILIGINTMSLFFYYPNGIIRTNMTQQYFLGIENRFVFVFLPFTAYYMINDIVKKGKITIKAWAVYAFCLGNLVFVWTVGSFLGFACMGILLFVLLKWGNVLERYVNSMTCGVFVILLNVGLVFFDVQVMFGTIITSVLHKDVGLTSRTLLWDAALKGFYKNPLFGSGVKTLEEASRELANINMAHAHNLFVNYLYQGGGLYLLLFFIIMWICVKKLYVYRNTKIAKVLLAVLFASFIVSLADTYDSAPFWLIVISCFHIDKLVEFEKRSSENEN